MSLPKWMRLVAVFSFILAKAWDTTLTILLFLLSPYAFFPGLPSPRIPPLFAFSTRKPTLLTGQIFCSIPADQLREKQLKSLSSSHIGAYFPASSVAAKAVSGADAPPAARLQNGTRNGNCLFCRCCSLLPLLCELVLFSLKGSGIGLEQQGPQQY